MEDLLKNELGSKIVKRVGSAGGGCISAAASYETDNYGRVFVKSNTQDQSRRMFDGESASLEALQRTDTVRVPKPIKVCAHSEGTGAVFIMEHLDIQSLRAHSKKLGEQLARLHLYNSSIQEKQQKEESRIGGLSGDQSLDQSGDSGYISSFGFHVTTCCGYLPQDNTWSDSWVEFYTRNKLGKQLQLLEERRSDREALELWPQLQRKIPKLFEGLEICPSLLHGDLWSGNIGQIDTGPVIFDPASFFGHSEFEFGIATMFGGFSSAFYEAYHKVIPKTAGFSRRQKLYQLFHYLNHWNHFGSGYRGSSISIMRELVT